MKFFSTSLCFGLLALLSVTTLLHSVRGRPHLSSGHELFPAEEHTTQEKLPLGLLIRNPGFQRPAHAGVDLPSKVEELRQLKKLREWFMAAKSAEPSNALDKLSSSHPNKRGWSWQSRNSEECLGYEPPQFQGYTYHFYWQACFWKYCV